MKMTQVGRYARPKLVDGSYVTRTTTVEMEIEIDIPFLVKKLARQLATNRTAKTQFMSGAIKAKRLSRSDIDT